jgi:hypothetical protein
MFLFDGLDEIKDSPSRLAFINQVKLFADAHKKVNILMSSRLVGFKQITNNLFSDFYRWLILPLNKNEIEHLCIRWHQILFSGDEDVVKSAKKLSDTISSNERIYKLAQVPILLTTLLFVNKQHGGRLPIRRTELYQKTIEVLLYTWGEIIGRSIDIRYALPHLAYLAHQMTFSDGVQQKIGESKLIEILKEAQMNLDDCPLYFHTASDNDVRYFKDVYDFLDKVEERSSLLLRRGYSIKEGTSLSGEREYEFLHLTYQEYLTSYAIIKRYYPEASDTSNVNDCFEGNWENPALKEVILLTSVLTGRFGTSKLVQGILNRLKKIEASRNSYRQSTITHLKNLLLQMITDEAYLTPSDREMIYKACFSANVESDIFRNEFLSIYESEHKDKMEIALKLLDQERKYPLYTPFFQFIKEFKANPTFSIFSYYKKIEKNNGLLEAIKVLAIVIWLDWNSLNLKQIKKDFNKNVQIMEENQTTNSQNEDSGNNLDVYSEDFADVFSKENLMKNSGNDIPIIAKQKEFQNKFENDLLSYCMSENEELAFFAYQVLYEWHNDNDPIFCGKLLQSLLRFSSESIITRCINKFSITQDTLIFLHGNSPTKAQIEAFNKTMEQEMNPEYLVQHFKFGTLCGVWDITTVILKAKEFHYADYITKKDSNSLFIWMQDYLSVLKETNSLITDEKILAENYQQEVSEDLKSIERRVI